MCVVLLPLIQPSFYTQDGLTHWQRRPQAVPRHLYALRDSHLRFSLRDLLPRLRSFSLSLSRMNRVRGILLPARGFHALFVQQRPHCHVVRYLSSIYDDGTVRSWPSGPRKGGFSNLTGQRGLWCFNGTQGHGKVLASFLRMIYL